MIVHMVINLTNKLALLSFCPCLFEEKGGDIVFGFPWCVIHDLWWVVPSL